MMIYRSSMSLSKVFHFDIFFLPHKFSQHRFVVESCSCCQELFDLEGLRTTDGVLACRQHSSWWCKRKSSLLASAVSTRMYNKKYEPRCQLWEVTVNLFKTQLIKSKDSKNQRQIDPLLCKPWDLWALVQIIKILTIENLNPNRWLLNKDWLGTVFAILVLASIALG